MQFASMRVGQSERWGVVDGSTVYLAPGDGAAPASLRALIEAGGDLPDTADWEHIPLADCELRAPIPEPRRNVMCLGLNYADHAAESQGTTPDQVELPRSPVVFTKATTTVTGPYADIPVDSRVTRRLDWEVELAFVIGRGGRFIARSEAMQHVFGYTIVNDLSARERQKHHKQFFLGKSMDASCPMGPWITTADAVPDPHALAISSTVNGDVKQDSSTRNLIFDIPRIIEELSTVMTLLPGDIIATGTPAGVGFARTPPEYLHTGDVVECHIEGLGALRNTISE
ncbi:fumarylacetoacetate hydrolase family protein [Halofilum ochraceum]|uniref:fumarylacetoacetate hydrolase family protein n=1 Tax=Halofilum ochraceum TaxID=1611323 RepID=UPI00082A1E04|nr:fumarylacetoacetate hydrolase family protein [Halofilum ochraceum]